MAEEKSQNSLSEKTEAGISDNIEELKALLAKEQEKSVVYLASWQRAAADLINYRKRADQEKSEAGNVAASLLIIKILPVLDDLERALACHIDEDVSQSSLIEGVKNIHRKFLTVLESEGISPLKTVGEKFDPSLHEAIMQGEGEPGKVIAEVRKGYRYKDRVLRAALVIVGKEKEEQQNKEH